MVILYHFVKLLHKTARHQDFYVMFCFLKCNLVIVRQTCGYLFKASVCCLKVCWIVTMVLLSYITGCSDKKQKTEKNPKPSIPFSKIWWVEFQPVTKKKYFSFQLFSSRILLIFIPLQCEESQLRKLSEVKAPQWGTFLKCISSIVLKIDGISQVLKHYTCTIWSQCLNFSVYFLLFCQTFSLAMLIEGYRSLLLSETPESSHWLSVWIPSGQILPSKWQMVEKPFKFKDSGTLT